MENEMIQYEKRDRIAHPRVHGFVARTETGDSQGPWLLCWRRVGNGTSRNCALASV